MTTNQTTQHTSGGAPPPTSDSAPSQGGAVSFKWIHPGNLAVCEQAIRLSREYFDRQIADDPAMEQSDFGAAYAACVAAMTPETTTPAASHWWQTPQPFYYPPAFASVVPDGCRSHVPLRTYAAALRPELPDLELEALIANAVEDLRKSIPPDLAGWAQKYTADIQITLGPDGGSIPPNSQRLHQPAPRPISEAVNHTGSGSAPQRPAGSSDAPNSSGKGAQESPSAPQVNSTTEMATALRQPHETAHRELV